DHANLDTPTDFDRIARRITGKAIGLVLGGGGARGLNHIGVIAALRDCGVPVDMVGGTSMGGIISAFMALGWSPEKMSHELDAASRKLDLTLPLVSMLSGAAFTKQLIEACGETQVEDLWLPFFCVSANLTRGEVMVHQNGL